MRATECLALRSEAGQEHPFPAFQLVGGRLALTRHRVECFATHQPLSTSSVFRCALHDQIVTITDNSSDEKITPN